MSLADDTTCQRFLNKFKELDTKRAFLMDVWLRHFCHIPGTLVAFSGEVNDKASGPDGFTENSPALNPGLKGRDIREAFKGDEYQILLVANKFQTGFDQPLLCGMYVDKRLAGIRYDRNDLES